MPDLDYFIQRFGGFTEPYFFYNNTVELRYDPAKHVYFLVEDGELVVQDGVTSVVHIIDKSSALVPWGCKMMGEKLLADIPKVTLPTQETIVPQQTLADFTTLVTQAKGAHKTKLEDAANVGHLAHNWIEQYIKSLLAKDTGRTAYLLAHPPEDPRAHNCCIAALHWMSRHNVRWLSTERKIYSRSYRYAGTMDGLCLVDSCSDPACQGCQGRVFQDHLTVADWKSSNYLYLEYLYQTAAYMHAYREEMEEPVVDRWVIRLGKEDGEFDPWYAPWETFDADLDGFVLALLLTRRVAATEVRIAEYKERQKAIRKEERQAAAEARKRIACAGSRMYKGVRPPKCNGGHPCQTCIAKYLANHPEKIQLYDTVSQDESTQCGPARPPVDTSAGVPGQVELADCSVLALT